MACTNCRECGKSLAGLGLKPSATFCTVEHRKAFNNRRMQRGAELYDIFMALRYEREFATEHNLFTVLSSVARAYRDSDKVLRDGRKSWNAKETVERLPMAFGKEGDKR